MVFFIYIFFAIVLYLFADEETVASKLMSARESRSKGVI